jgi:hypothetical protein
LAEPNEDAISELVDQSGRYAMVGDVVQAEQSLAKARELDPIAFEIELAKRAWANQTGGRPKGDHRMQNMRRTDLPHAYCGSVETSSSHFFSRRLRSSLDPYFLKS